LTFEGEWARCAPWLQAALDRSADGYSIGDALAEVMAGRATFWPGPHAAMVTEKWNGPHGAEANVWIAGGSLRALLGMAPLVEARLKDTGHVAVSIIGRPGWARALKAIGYAQQGGELRKAL
jgi:hypothetical protein